MRGGAFAGAAVALVASGLALRIIPPPAGTAAAGLSGLPHQLGYGVGGVALALTGVQCVPKLDRGWRPTRAADLALGIGLAVSGGLTAVNARRLLVDLADPLGPPLWLGAMLALLVAAIVASGPFAWR